LDGTEVVPSARAGQEPAETLEVPIAFSLAAVLAVQIDALAVHLPVLDQRVAHRIALRIENSTTQMCDLADRRRDRVVDDEQGVVGVQRQLIRVERSLGLRGSPDQLLGECAADREGGRAKGECAQKRTTTLEGKERTHRNTPRSEERDLGKVALSRSERTP